MQYGVGLVVLVMRQLGYVIQKKTEEMKCIRLY